MRRIMLLAAVLVACKKGEAPKTETAAPAAAPVAATATMPARLTPADLAGTWKGTTMMENTDSVIGRWTVIMVNDSTSKYVANGSRDTVALKVTYSADSMVATSAPHVDTAVNKKSKIVFVAMGHLKDGKLGGTSVIRLADKPDSVVGRSRWEATKAP